MCITSCHRHNIHTAYIHQSFLGQLWYNKCNGSLHACHVVQRWTSARLTQTTHQWLFTGSRWSHCLRDNRQALAWVKLVCIGR